MLKSEKNYDFRARMREVHPKGIRNAALVAAQTELELKNGCTIALPDDAGEVILTAARDFCHYLHSAMGVYANVCQGEGTVNICVDEAYGSYRSYCIRSDDSIHITAHDERGAAQALYELESEMSARRAPFIRRGTYSRTPAFSPRMTHSGYGLDDYPDEHLSLIAHAGMDAILVFTEGPNKTPSGFLDFNELVRRAARYGLDVYLYSYIESRMHPRDPGALEHYEDIYGTLFESCPDVKGIVLVGESIEFPSRDENVSPKRYYQNSSDGIPDTRVTAGFWPCSDYPEWLNMIKSVIRRRCPQADIVFWTYNWGWAPEEARVALINNLPTDISLMTTFEMFHSYPLENVVETCADYTLSFEGPGEYFISEARAAKARGIRLYTQSNSGGLTWDIGVIPYEPMPQQWLRRYRNMLRAREEWGLCGVMESHHYGYWPSFIGDLERCCFEQGFDDETALERSIAMRFSTDEIPKFKDAFALWSEAIRHYNATNEDQYGAMRVGPAYPFMLERGFKPPLMPHNNGNFCFVPYSAENSDRLSPCAMRLKPEIRSLEKMKALIDEGLEVLNTVEGKNIEVEYLINLGSFISCCVQTGINAKRWYILTGRLHSESDASMLLHTIDEAEKLLRSEKENVTAAVPLVCADSRLGWEPRMEYRCDERCLKWKLRQLDYVLNKELENYRKALRLPSH